MALLFPNILMLQNASYVFFKKKQIKTKRLRKKEKSLTRQESNWRPSTCKGNALSIASRNHMTAR